MIIELTPYEKNNLVRMLDYTAEQKRKDYKKRKISQELYDNFLDELFILRKRIEGVKPKINLGNNELLKDLFDE